ncbi:MAG: hypothetical protein A4E57_02614 [Syntrophorhabdaceae bacterium PtaU1.Bin034]|nr:MAG: hypothetical protein A4E57_02614 [Syntrophorhabdaceae bacterium PtaU1.Bin034]
MNNNADNNEPEAIWDFIRYLREQRGLSLVKFVEMIACTLMHATRIEKLYNVSRSAASPRLFRCIAAACTDDPESCRALVARGVCD